MLALGGRDGSDEHAGPAGAAATGGGSPGGAAGAGAGGSKLVANATPQPDWQPHTGPVPILEYHVLGAAPADAPYPELYVTRPDFRRQMDWLERQGYRGGHPRPGRRRPGTGAGRCRRSRS